MSGGLDLSRLGGWRFALLFAALFAVGSLPVVLCDTLPLFDYPNHLARMHVLAGLDQSPALQSYYDLRWRPLPNLAMDLLVPPLSQLIPLGWAGRGFVLLTLFLLVGSAATLHRALFGGWSAWPCVAFLLLYSRVLLWGFLNYLFGLGLGLLALAAWIALAGRPPLLRLLLGTIFAFAVFFAHLLAFGLYGVMVVGYEAGLARRRGAGRRGAPWGLALAVLALLPALAVLVLATPGSAGGSVGFGQPWRKLDLLFSVFDNYNRTFDVVCFVIFVLMLSLAFWRRWVRLAPSLAAPLVLLAAAYLAMPSRLATAYGADHRIPLLLGLLLVAGSRWTAPALGAQRLFFGAALVLFLVRMGIVTASWQASDRVYAGLLPAFDRLPVGSRLAVAYPPEALNSEATPLAHLPTLAIVRRDAFVPTLFAYATQQPVALRPDYRALADRLPPERLWQALVTGTPPLDTNERAALAAYDHIVFVGRRSFDVTVAPSMSPVFVAPRFALFALALGGVGLDDTVPAR
jgi:hypothetical protein